MARRIVATEFVSLDGYMDEPGNWTEPFRCPEGGAVKERELRDAEALLLGRRTYEVFAGAWPAMADSEFGERMNSLPKHVVSRTLTETTWNASLIEGDVVDGVRKLVDGSGGDLLLMGSGELFNRLAEHDLIDVYRLMVFPVVLHGEQPLFTSAPRRTLKLVDAQVLPTGAVVQTYERAE
jgi:dihydrofolate reductase